jgi:trigger factor
MPETTTERANKVFISDAGPARKKISIQVPAETVSEKLAGSLDTFMGEAQLPGFRKGRAPKGLVEKRFGSAMRDETKKQLVAEAYQEAIKDANLKIVGEPFSETLEKVEIKAGQPLEFEIEVEVMPEFTLPSLDAIPVRKPLVEVTDAMVREEFEKLRINEGRLESRDSAEPGDYLTGRGRMVGSDGKEFYDINGAVVQKPAKDKNGQGMILGILVPDFDKQFGSPKPGETATVKAKGPEQHEIEGIRNNDLTITFEVERIDRIIPADPNALAQQYGLADETQFLDIIRSRMAQRVLIQQHTAMRSQIALHLVKNTQMELPQRLTAQQAVRTLERQRLELMYRGVEPAVIEQRMAELRGASGQIAAGELKLFFILAKIAEDLNIQVTEGEINGRISQMAAERGVRVEALRQELIQRNQVYGVFQQIREHKTYDAILSKAAVTDMSLEEYTKYIEAERAGAVQV